MGRKSTGLFVLLLAIAVLPGCVVSSQDGERAHINSKHPDEIAFHFDTGFNKGIVIGRSAMLLLVAAWLVFKRTGGPNTLPIILGVAATVAAVWLAVAGFSRIGGYRVDVSNEALHWQVPGSDTLNVAWSDIEGLEVEGMARDVSMGGNQAPGSMQWSAQWEDLMIYHTDGRIFDADLRPLSVEQRGTLWRAIARKSELEMGRPTVMPANN